MTEAGSNGRDKQGQKRDDGDGPRHALLIDRLAVGKLSFDAGLRDAGTRAVDIDLDRGIQIGHGVSDAWDCADGRCGQVQVGV